MAEAQRAGVVPCETERSLGTRAIECDIVGLTRKFAFRNKYTLLEDQYWELEGSPDS